MDLNYSRDTTSGREGLDLIARVRAHDRGLPVVVMTGWGSIDIAVEAMRRGARSFVQKPWDDATLLEVVRREIDEARAARRRDGKVEREHEEARLIQRGPDARHISAAAARAGLRHLAAGRRRRRRLLRRAQVQRHELRAVDRRRLGQGAAGGAADVEPAGVGPRLRLGNDAAARSRARASTGCSAGTWRAASSSRSATASSTRRATCVDLHQCRTQSADSRARRRVERAAHPGRHGARRVSRLGLRTAADVVRSGDRLVLFTDGISEAQNAEGEEFGEERLVEIALAARHRTAADMQAAIFDAVNASTAATITTMRR